KIRERARLVRFFYHCEDRSVGRVNTAPPIFPLAELWIASHKPRAVQHLPVPLHPVDDPYLVAILEVLAYAGKINAHFDTVLFKLVFRSNPGEHQKLRRVESTAGEDYLARSIGHPFITRFMAGIGVGLV